MKWPDQPRRPQIVAEEAAADEQEYLPVARAERRPGWKN